MPVTELRVSNYRSIREIQLPMKPVNVILGPNGCGKSNLYNSIALIQAAVEGRLGEAIVAEGGLGSILWAGPRKSGPVRLTLQIAVEDFEYRLVLGLPQNERTLFNLDPQIKEEHLTLCEGKRRIAMLERKTGTCSVRAADGSWNRFDLQLIDSESVIAQISDPQQFPMLSGFARNVRRWRFYHSFRSDAASPMRQPQVGTRTFILAADGIDLAAALQTIFENGDDRGLQNSISDAFPGARLMIDRVGHGLEIAMRYPGMTRPLDARELSDGTLRYLALCAALLSPKPAPFIAINEPETSLHHELLPPLARLIKRVAGASQIWLTTHASVLADEVSSLTGSHPIALEKIEGATIRKGRPAKAAFSAAYDIEASSQD